MVLNKMIEKIVNTFDFMEKNRLYILMFSIGIWTSNIIYSCREYAPPEPNYKIECEEYINKFGDIHTICDTTYYKK